MVLASWVRVVRSNWIHYLSLNHESMCRYNKLFPCLIFWLHDHKKIVCYGGVVVQQITLSSMHVLQCLTHYCVQHFTVSSKILYPHLFLIYTCSTSPCWLAVVVPCNHSPLLFVFFFNLMNFVWYIIMENAWSFWYLTYRYLIML